MNPVSPPETTFQKKRRDTGWAAALQFLELCFKFAVLQNSMEARAWEAPRPQFRTNLDNRLKRNMSFLT